MIRTSVKIIAVLLLALFQISFLSHFEPLQQACNFVLLGVILTSVWVNSKQGLYFGLIAGLCLDIFSSYSFGLITLSLTLPILLVNYAFKKILTRRSIYSTLLIVLSNTLIYWLSLFVFTTIIAWFNWHPTAMAFNNEFLHLVAVQTIFNVTATILIYFFYKFVNTHFRMNFLNQT